MIAPAVATGSDQPQPERTGTSTSPRPRFVRWSFGWVTVVVVVGVLVTAGLAILSAELSSSNEQHLLDLRSKEVASTLTSVLPDIQTPLGAAAALADITGANPSKFDRFAASYVGVGRPFVSISVWRRGHLDEGPVDTVGATPELPAAHGGATAILRAASARTGLTVRGLLHAAEPRLGYAYAGSRSEPFIVEAEQALPASRYTSLPVTSAYSNLNVAVYIAKRPVASRLLFSTVRQLPLTGQHSTAHVPFGSSTLDVVISAREPLGGTLPERMPWVIVIIGVLLTIGAGVLTFRLIVGGRRAQTLARENRHLYGEQREIAQSLQHALLPEELPKIDGVQLSALYAAGVPGIDIGGDWYDLIRLDADRLLLVVGDVSGRGIRAATAMASLRFAIQYAAQSDAPEVFLPKLSGVRSLHESGQLATVLCVVIDVNARRVSVTSAGHLPPLVIHDGDGEFLLPEVGLPIGVDTEATYLPSTFTVPEGATLLGFTDGLVERHGENLDDGLDRLRRAAAAAKGDLDEVMAEILELLTGTGSVDDTAMAGIKWLNQTL